MAGEQHSAHHYEEVRLSDYRPYPYLVENVRLVFELEAEKTVVTARIAMRLREGEAEGTPVSLCGRNLITNTVAIDGIALTAERYAVEPDRLTVFGAPASFTLEIETTIHPAANASLEGLYASGGILCTQCEAEGFRRMTWYPDRPDVLSTFTTTLVADRERYPVLLSNGDLVDSGELDGGRHFATWRDPFLKPGYLFALVAGDLRCNAGTFTTRSGKKVDLRIYVKEADLARTEFAMGALKRAMRWDEERFGREYDLDTFMIVAVDDFNAGAMENKGLNIFNASCVLADGASAADDDFDGIERVIGHEYFHNWTGNRVTCRDWFQLSLKEGLTIYRDEEFSADMNCRATKRIADVRFLRTIQFPEDGGPLAHPVRPASYIEIGNFYTTTVYRKGSEVVRMIASLLGEETFRRGMDLYFDRYDGQAVTVEDFVNSMAEAGEIDLRTFMRWYTQAGTPIVHAQGVYDTEKRTFSLTLRQEIPSTPGQSRKEPLLIPVALGLLDSRGREIHLRLEGEETHSGTARVVQLRETEETFVFVDVPERPVPSLFRNFSAPVRMDAGYTTEDLILLLAHDTDPFNRWESAQKLATSLILDAAAGTGEPDLERLAVFADAVAEVLADPAADPAFVAEVLALPTEDALADMMPVADPDSLHIAREAVRRGVALRLEPEFLRLSRAAASRPYAPDDGRRGARRLAGVALSYLAALERDDHRTFFVERYRQADNMTDTISALVALNASDSIERREVLQDFFHRWRDNRQVIDKWYAMHAAAPHAGALGEVKELLADPLFEITNPNRVRALIGTFSVRNHCRFHSANGEGYRLLADVVIRLDGANSQLAARLLPPLTRWRRYDPERQALMKGELERILARKKISRDVFEVVTKSLAGGNAAGI